MQVAWQVLYLYFKLSVPGVSMNVPDLCYARIFVFFFQEALLKSSEVFETFKQEIEKVYLFLWVAFSWVNFSCCLA